MSDRPPPFYTAGYLMVDIPIIERRTTLYTQAGDWLPWVCVIAGGIAVLFVLGRGMVRLIMSLQARRRRIAGGKPPSDAHRDRVVPK